MRGEDPSTFRHSSWNSGSPPHARGRQRAGHPRPPSNGITPACAGKTRLWLSPKCSMRDHPRMRGEDEHSSDVFAGSRGSPPHARGRRPDPPLSGHTARITPACAGKTHKPERVPGLMPDHPRMRGEDPSLMRAESLHLGSPPHARGRRRPQRLCSRGARITPACAGKTSPHEFDATWK